MWEKKIKFEFFFFLQKNPLHSSVKFDGDRNGIFGTLLKSVYQIGEKNKEGFNATT